MKVDLRSVSEGILLRLCSQDHSGKNTTKASSPCWWYCTCVREENSADLAPPA